MNETRFDLNRLMTTVFEPKRGENVGVFIDLVDPRTVTTLAFLDDPDQVTRRIAYNEFYQGLLRQREKMGWGRIEFFAYVPTGGSNLDLPDTVVNLEGKTERLVEEVLPRLNIVLYLSTYSATAPITALAKKMGFRGATMHGANDIILHSGLAQDYNLVSIRAERFRRAVTKCDDVVIEFDVLGKKARLTLELGKQEAQKSHGLCRPPGEIANLPAGEIYWVPTGAHGQFPLKFKDGTIGLMDVADCRITGGTLLKGSQATLDVALEKFRNDPATGGLGELGLGTQLLPVAGADIQDEKVLGTFHVATGRSDHLGGNLTPEKFKNRKNATHEDILFAPHKTPEIKVPGVWMHKDGQEILLIAQYEPTEFVKQVAL
jgi:hypothetical protein